MSTRSGKRLHNTFDEDIKQIEPELVLKSERKTRSKRVVDNGHGQGVVLKTKKRQNYVSYPADEEVVELNTHENEILVVPTRALRRNTLREQNTASDVELATQMKKQVRQTRRTKKFSETAPEEAPEIPQQEEVMVPITNGKPKSKKNKKKIQKHVEQAELMNKENNVKKTSKKNRKKKKSKSNSLEQEEIHNDMSMDSFHSAAGSPVCVETNTLISPNITSSPQDPTQTSTSVTNVSNSKKKRKSSLRNNSLGVNSPVEEAMDIDINLGEVHTTFDKDNNEINKKSKKKKSTLKNETFDKDSKPETPVELNTTFEKEATNDIATNKRKRKSDKTELAIENGDIPAPIKISNGTLNTTFEKDSKPVTPVKVNTTFEKESTNDKASNKKKWKSDITELAIDGVDIPPPIKFTNGILNTTFEKDDNDTNKKPRKSNITQQINEIPPVITLQSSTTSVEKIRKSSRKSITSEKLASLNGTFDLSPKTDSAKPKSLDTTFDKEKLDSTFDKTDTQKPASKSSLISSDGTESTINVTLDKSDELSRISITDDDSKTENILNTTPLLVESSMEESKLENSLKENKTPETQPKLATTPLKREGTFTKEDSDVTTSPRTPSKRQTLPTAGCTPYHPGSQKKSVLNLTHSIEKGRRSSLAEVAPRMTRVMFCSPVNNPAVVTQQKSKVIKSNLKGSNKSFVYEESESVVPRAGRKRSFTHTEGESAAGAAAGAKRTRLLAPVARARTASAAAKLSATPQKATPIPKQQSSVKSKLPNFAALHARSFDRMESLDECQERRARRARQLLVPTGSLAVLERSSPRVTIEAAKPRDTPKPATPIKPAAKLPTLDSLQRGYTRFGFKMHCENNPFSVPSKTVTKPKEIKPKSISNLKRPQPSLAGATSLRRAAAKQTIMREKSFTLSGKRDEKREEFRTVIKGVRTNRRFELQMRSRNINA